MKLTSFVRINTIVFIVVATLSSCEHSKDCELTDSLQSVTFDVSFANERWEQVRGFSDATLISADGLQLEVSHEPLPGFVPTRGTALNIESLNEFYVTAISYRRWSTSSIPAPNLMYDECVRRNGDVWSTSNHVFWPSANKVRFFAYAPHHDNLVLSAPDYQGLPVLSCTIADAPVSQPDLIVAVPTEIDVADYNGKNGQPSIGVPLVFHHVLASVALRVSESWPEDGSEVISVAFRNVNGSGTFVMDNYWNSASTSDIAPAWTLSNLRDYTIEISEPTVAGAALINQQSMVMMLPQSFSDDATMVVSLRDSDGIVSDISVPLAGTNWTMGRLTTYTLSRK